MTFTVTEPHTKRTIIEVPESVQIDAGFLAQDFAKGTLRRGPAWADATAKGSCNVRVTDNHRINISCFGFNGPIGTDGLMSVEFDPADLVALGKWIVEAEIVE